MQNFIRLVALGCFLLLLGNSGLLPAQDNRPSSPEKVDFDKARLLLQREAMGQKLTSEESAYLERAKAARRAMQGGSPDSRMIGGKEKVGLKPLSEMTAEDHYQKEDGGLYGNGKNSPPEKHRQAAEQAIAKLEPLDPSGRPSNSGTIGFVSISMSNATQEFSLFKQLADRSQEKSLKVTIVDCAQGGQAMAEWVDPKGRPWEEARRRMVAANLSREQVQVVWIKLANKGPRGTLQEHGTKLENDTLAVIQNAKKEFPNLKIAYLSSRIYGGYSTGMLNPEPYAYESAFPVRWLIQRQIKGDKALAFQGERTNAPLLLWGPYLWADGITPRKADGMHYLREDLAQDGTHPSQQGRQKVASFMLNFFLTDPLTKPWFAR
ncbi:MAG: hypothetical protein ACO1RA_20140 [Planctomycetaceae bacterium]